MSLNPKVQSACNWCCRFVQYSKIKCLNELKQRIQSGHFNSSKPESARMAESLHHLQSLTHYCLTRPAAASRIDSRITDCGNTKAQSLIESCVSIYACSTWICTCVCMHCGAYFVVTTICIWISLDACKHIGIFLYLYQVLKRMKIMSNWRIDDLPELWQCKVSVSCPLQATICFAGNLLMLLQFLGHL